MYMVINTPMQIQPSNNGSANHVEGIFQIKERDRGIAAKNFMEDKSNNAGILRATPGIIANEKRNDYTPD